MQQIDRQQLAHEFNHLRQTQARKLNRYPCTRADWNAASVVFNTAWQATRDVEDGGKSGVTMRAVSLATGMGKSTSAYAFITAACKLDRNFSAAYIAPTVKMALEAQHGIELLLGKGSTTLWSTHHDARGQDETEAEESLGFIPERLVDKSELPASRVIIVTHKLWTAAARKGKADLVSHYKGKRRDVIFVDESPDLIELVEARPSEVQELLDALHEHDALPEARTVLAAVISRMNQVAEATGQTYSPHALLSPAEARTFTGIEKTTLKPCADENLSESKRGEVADRWMALLGFLRCAASGCCFYSRLDRGFFSYRLDFDPGPGHVLLDATADLTGLVTLNDSVEEVQVPQVDYSNLMVVHIAQPREFRRISAVTKSAAKARPYADWMKQVVLLNSELGDDVLVVTHRAMLDHEYIPNAGDPTKPVDWEGRKVNTLHWGGPWVGLSNFKDKTHVFLFSEFYQPRPAVIGDTHGYSGRPLTKESLKLAEGRRVQGDEFAPGGPYRAAYEGHLLRWTKQLAMRGRARQIDREGKARPMVLVTSMEKGRLIRNFDKLFPGAKPFGAANRPLSKIHGSSNESPARKHSVPGDAVTGTVCSRRRHALVELLESTRLPILWADYVEVRTGIPQRNLSREVRSASVAPVVTFRGYRLSSAQELGRAGRMRCLVNDRLLVKATSKPTGRTTLGELLRH